MQAPFIYGKLAEGTEFTNRSKELERLKLNFSSGINTILISPRRWGKTSLVKKAASQLEARNKKLRFCFIDLFNIRSEEAFYELLASEVVRATSTKWEERISYIKRFLSAFIPKVTYSADPANELSLGLDWKEVKAKPDEILNLAERIASENDFRIVICIDEFQHLNSLDNPLNIQQKLRSHWQKHQHTSYCLYGSKRHMMQEIFSSPAMPFYKFGDILFLEKIAEKHWVTFIKKRFAQTGKKIPGSEASRIAKLAENHPYYVQQLAQQCWLRSNETCTEKVVDEAFHSLLMQLSLLFQGVNETLTPSQLGFLETLINEVAHPSSKENLEKYSLGTSANVIRVKDALQLKDIIDKVGEEINFQDPLYKAWLRLYYFRQKFSKQTVQPTEK